MFVISRRFDWNADEFEVEFEVKFEVEFEDEFVEFVDFALELELRLVETG